MPNRVLHDLLTREITAADATAAARLSGELGYLVAPEIMQRASIL
jgi:hypothetical protein